VLLLRVDDEQAGRQAAHALDAAQVDVHLLDLAVGAQRLLLGEDVEAAFVAGLLELEEAVDRLLDRLPVGEGAAQPTVVDVEHLAPRRLFGDDVASGALGADEQHGAAVGHGLVQEPGGVHQPARRALQVDDVDPVLGAVDVRLHLRVPPTGLVTEVDAGLQEIAQRDVHGSPPVGFLRRGGSDP
jgi:hypothetical protein